MLWPLLACTTPPPEPRHPNPGEDAHAQAARAAPMIAAPWTGPWTVTVYGAGPAADALAEGLHATLSAWDGRRPRTRPGEAAVVWLPSGSDLAALVPALSPDGPAGGDVIAVLAPGDPAWSSSAADRLPWANVSIVDPAISVSVWVDPAAAADPVVAGRAAAQAVADHYGVPYVPTTAALPVGLEWLGVPTQAGLTAPDARTRAATVLAASFPVESLAGDPEVGVRLAVAARTHDAATLARLAADPDPQVRARAADQLDDVALLDNLATDPSSVVRVVATDRLAHLAETRPTEVSAALRRAAASPDAYQRWKAAWGLGKVPDGLDALLPMLQDVDIDVRREAARSLGRHPDPRAVDALLVALTDTNSFVRRWAADALGQIGDPKAKDALRTAAADPTSLVAQAAARSLTRLGEPTQAPPFFPPAKPKDDAELEGWLQSPDATVRKDAAKFLAGRDGSTPQLERLAKDHDSEVRKSAVEAMGWSPATAPAVLPFLADPDPDVLVTALDALRRAGVGTVEAIAPLRTHADAEIRLRAAEALAALGPSDAVLACLADPDERVRAAAVRVYPDRLAADEPSALVVAAAHPAPAPLAWWAAGVFAREDDLLHLRFSWNEATDRPLTHRALRPPTIRAYGHPDRG